MDRRSERVCATGEARWRYLVCSLNGRTDARTDGLMDARMNGRMDGRADGRKCSVALFFFFVREGKILNCHTEVPDINRIRS